MTSRYRKDRLRRLRVNNLVKATARRPDSVKRHLAGMTELESAIIATRKGQYADARVHLYWARRYRELGGSTNLK